MRRAPGESGLDYQHRLAYGIQNIESRQQDRRIRGLDMSQPTGPIGREIKPCDEQCKSFFRKPSKWFGLSVLTGISTGVLISELIGTYNSTNPKLDEDKRQEKIDLLTKLLLATGSMFTASVVGFAVTCRRQYCGNRNNNLSSEEGQGSSTIADMTNANIARSIEENLDNIPLAIMPNVRVESAAQSQSQVQSA